MIKSKDILRTNLTQNLRGSIVQNLLAAVMFGTKPLGPEHYPDCLGYVKMGALLRKEENIEASFHPLINLPCHLPFAMDGCIVKQDERRPGYPSGESVKIIGKYPDVYGFYGIEVKIHTCQLEEDSHSSFAFLMLYLCFFKASFTAGVTFRLIRGFWPLSPFFLRSSRPSFPYRLCQLYKTNLPYPTTCRSSSYLHCPHSS